MSLDPQLYFATFSLPSSFVAGNSVIQSDGKVLITGASDNELIVARFNTKGELDVDFGANGIVEFKPASVTSAGVYGGPIAVAPDGTIITSTSTYSGGTKFQISADGKTVKELTTANGTYLLNNGQLFTPAQPPAGGISAVMQQADGKVIIAGGKSQVYGGTYSFTLARYNPDGSIDTSFGNAGNVVSSGLGTINSVVQLSDGKLVAVGAQFGSKEIVIARYTSSGALDTSFGDAGVIRTNPNSLPGSLFDVTVQNDGKIVGCGYSGSDLLIVRFLANGALDTTFSGDGIATIDFGRNASAFEISGIAMSVNVQADGKIIAYGTRENMRGGVGVPALEPVLVRLNTDGSVDSGFGQPFYNMTGTGQDDVFEVMFGSSTYVNGLDGTDAFLVRSDPKFWTVTERADDWLLASTNGAASVVLKNVEYVKFVTGSTVLKTVALQKVEGSPDNTGVHRIIVSPEVTEVSGTPGQDVAAYTGKLSGFTIKRTSDSVTVSSLTTGTDTIRNVERLEFSDKTINLNIKNVASSISATDLKLLQELYVAFFNRVPDADGLEYWIGQFKSGMTLKQIAESF